MGRAALIAALAACCMAGDWPQHQHDARRSGYTPDEIRPPYTLAWKRCFLPERPARRTQAIVYRSRVFVGTQQGVMHCFDAATGKELWTRDGLGSIQHSAGCADGKVFVGSLDGRVYALDAETGTIAWRTSTSAGFTVAPLLADGKVLMGNRRGSFYALDQKTGKPVWTHTIDGPIFGTACADDRRVFFGGEDIRIYALDLRSGKRLWASDQLQGMSMKDYHPVVHKGFVVVRPMAHFQADIYNKHSPYAGAFKTPALHPGGWHPSWKGWPPPDGFPKLYAQATEERAGRMPPDLLKRQEAVIEHYTKHPEDQDLFVLRVEDGTIAFVAPHFRVNAMHGPVTPPVEDDDGLLIVPWVHVNNCWARYDIVKNRLVEFILPPTQTNADENLNASCGGRYIYIFHCEEGNANHTGIYDVKAKKWLPNPSPGVRWYDNLQSGANPVSVGSGRYFHILFYTLVARGTAEGGK